jgi:hypothetical protein
VGGPGAGCPQPAEDPPAVRWSPNLVSGAACSKWLIRDVANEAGLERREDRPPRASPPNGVKRPGRRSARNGDAVGCRTRGQPARGVTGRVAGVASTTKAGAVFGSPTVADARGPARPLPSRGEASSVRGEEAVAAGLERFRRDRRPTSGFGKCPVLRPDRIQGQGSPVSP